VIYSLFFIIISWSVCENLKEKYRVQIELQSRFFKYKSDILKKKKKNNVQFYVSTQRCGEVSFSFIYILDKIL
jgi:hypothetical protein